MTIEIVKIDKPTPRLQLYRNANHPTTILRSRLLATIKPPESELETGQVRWWAVRHQISNAEIADIDTVRRNFWLIYNNSK